VEHQAPLQSELELGRHHPFLGKVLSFSVQIPFKKGKGRKGKRKGDGMNVGLGGCRNLPQNRQGRVQQSPSHGKCVAGQGVWKSQPVSARWRVDWQPYGLGCHQSTWGLQVTPRRWSGGVDLYPGKGWVLYHF
jgi:hypothetical protein